MSSKKQNSYITLNERFNQNILNYLIGHKSEFFPKMRIYDDTYDPFDIATKYLKKSVNGQIKTIYKQNNSFGRFCAVGSLSLQSLPREIRHTISSEFYKDIDIKNAHPIILEHLCNTRNIACKALSKYNSNRDKYLSEIGDKKIILSLLNGGNKLYKDLKIKPDWLTDLKSEIKNIHKSFAKNKDFKKHKKDREKLGIDYNHEASYMNTLLCDYENNILQIIYRCLGSPKNCVLCFDGLMVEKDVDIDFELLQTSVFDKLGVKVILVEKPMDQGFDLPDEIPDYIEVISNTFNFKIKYDYTDFHNEFNQHMFDSYDDLDETISEKYQSVICRVLAGEGSYGKKLYGSENTVDTVKKLGKSDFTMFYQDDKKKIKLKLSDYLDSKHGFCNYECKIFNPNPKNFNLWGGFQASEILNRDYANSNHNKGLELLKTMIFETWAGGDVDSYNYIISWFKGLLVNDINRVALVLISEQGTGKGWLCGFLRYIINNSNIAECCGIENVIQKHNTYIQNKRLVIVNEMASTKDEFRSNFDKIKPLITDLYLRIEPKGVNSYTIDNIGNYILCSNHLDSISLEESDRRYAIFEVSPKYKQNKQYFVNLTNECYNQDTANAFYSYLLDFDSVNINDIPNSPARQFLINLSKHNSLKFLDALTEEPLTEFNPDTAEMEQIKEIKSIDLYECYRTWCTQNGERNIVTNTKFGLMIRGRLEKKRMNHGCVYILPRTV